MRWVTVTPCHNLALIVGFVAFDIAASTYGSVLTIMGNRFLPLSKVKRWLSATGGLLIQAVRSAHSSDSWAFCCWKIRTCFNVFYFSVRWFYTLRLSIFERKHGSRPICRAAAASEAEAAVFVFVSTYHKQFKDSVLRDLPRWFSSNRTTRRRLTNIACSRH